MNLDSTGSENSTIVLPHGYTIRFSLDDLVKLREYEKEPDFLASAVRRFHRKYGPRDPYSLIVNSLDVLDEVIAGIRRYSIDGTQGPIYDVEDAIKDLGDQIRILEYLRNNWRSRYSFFVRSFFSHAANVRTVFDHGGNEGFNPLSLPEWFVIKYGSYL